MLWANNIIIFIMGVLFGGPFSAVVLLCVLEHIYKRDFRELTKEEWKAGITPRR